MKVQTKTDQKVQCKEGGAKINICWPNMGSVSNLIHSYKDSVSNFWPCVESAPRRHDMCWELTESCHRGTTVTTWNRNYFATGNYSHSSCLNNSRKRQNFCAFAASRKSIVIGVNYDVTGWRNIPDIRQRAVLVEFCMQEWICCEVLSIRWPC